MARQFLCELDEHLNSFPSGKIRSRAVFSIKRSGKYFIEYIDGNSSLKIDEDNVVPCKMFLRHFPL